jgi:hypothetical protein
MVGPIRSIAAAAVGPVSLPATNSAVSPENAEHRHSLTRGTARRARNTGVQAIVNDWRPQQWRGSDNCQSPVGPAGTRSSDGCADCSSARTT